MGRRLRLNVAGDTICCRCHSEQNQITSLASWSLMRPISLSPTKEKEILSENQEKEEAKQAREDILRTDSCADR